MNKNVFPLTVLTSTLITGVATADYTGLSYTATDNGDGTWTARLYADFDQETDQLNAVFGDPDDALLISSNGAGFYQNSFGGATSAAINPAFYDMFPSLMNDSWVTIGLEDQTDNNMLDIGIDWTDFESGADISTDNGAWFATPDDPQVIAGGDLRVLVGQFTMLGLDSHLSGVLNIQGYHGDGLEGFQARGQVFNMAVPAPGAIALLGLAGISTCRRRR